jgi:hypothetical protein
VLSSCVRPCETNLICAMPSLATYATTYSICGLSGSGRGTILGNCAASKAMSNRTQKDPSHATLIRSLLDRARARVAFRYPEPSTTKANRTCSGVDNDHRDIFAPTRWQTLLLYLSFPRPWHDNYSSSHAIGILQPSTQKSPLCKDPKDASMWHSSTL